MQFRLVANIALIAWVGVCTAQVQSPKEFFGHDVCEDYWLANYADLTRYWSHLAAKSDRVRLVNIGKTEFGRDQWMTVISQPSNLRHLESHRLMSQRFNQGKFASAQEAARAAKKAKSVVWIDGGLHANEVLGAQQLIETSYQLATKSDEETKRILRDSIILIVHANPDGMDLVSNWYMRKAALPERSLANIPELYQKYGGHDNNRDFYMMNMAETRNMNKILYETWFPQIVYNHHQSAPAGTIMFIPPFRNPFNYHVDPIIQTATDLVGLNMHQRLISENLGGTVMRDGASFNAWWNGGLRTTTYFHNMVGILTETWGSPNPTNVPWSVERQIPSVDLPKPVDVRRWHLKDSLKYEVSSNYAILDYASRYRERLLMSVYTSARNSIERGSKDHWTRYPSRIREIGQDSITKPEYRDARQYVIPVDQPNWTSALRFVEALIRTGVEVHQLESDQVAYRAGSYVISCDQPYRAHILDMFEKQDYPNDFRFAGGPPIPPYDNAGYTLAYQMGVKFDRLLEPLAFKSKPVTTSKSVLDQSVPDSLTLPASENESFAIALRALKSGLSVERTVAGTFLVRGDESKIKTLKSNLKYGRLTAIADRSAATPLRSAPRIGLWDRFGGSMPSGWTRWLFDEFGFDYSVLYPQGFKGSLRSRFDAIVLPSGVSFSTNVGSAPANFINDPTIPEELKRRWGSMNVAESVPALRDFVRSGGTLMAIGSSASAVAEALELPVTRGLLANGRPLPNTEFYIPGSVLRMTLADGPLTVGYAEKSLDVMFDDSPAFLMPTSPDVEVVGSWTEDRPLRSGWAWGQDKLKGLAAILDVKYGDGRVVLYGPEVNFRGQSHGSFKLIFNALLRSSR
jgi:hypothetical protein